MTRENLLQLLCFDSIVDRFMNIETSYGNTCKWLLQSTEYLDWLDAEKLPEYHGFFWIKGKSECGKSTVTKFVFNEIQKSLRNTTLLSFFFNARGTELERTTFGLYRSLLVQLLKHYPSNAPALKVENSSLSPRTTPRR